MSDKFCKDFATVAVHGGYSPEDCLPHKPIVEPLICSSTFKQSHPGVYPEFDYGRTGNPCRKSLEKRLAALENAKFAATFPSGVSVAFAFGHLFPPGSHFIVSKDVYGGILKCFLNMEKRSGFTISYLDMTNSSQLKAALKEDTKLVWFETPTNPTLTVVDIKGVSELVRSVAKEAVIVVDNTFLTSYFQRPLELGATVSMYSLTKYVNGHADVIMGAAVTNCEKIHREMEFMQDGEWILFFIILFSFSHFPFF